MRWFLLVLLLSVAALAATAHLWWIPLQPYLGEPPNRLATLATVVAAVFTFLSFVVAIMAYRRKSPENDPTKQSAHHVDGSVVQGKVHIKRGDFIGRDKVTTSQRKGEKRS